MTTRATTLNACCDQWLDEVEALRPRAGHFVEERKCPTCQTTHRVIFEYGAVIGGELMGGAVGIEGYEP